MLNEVQGSLPITSILESRVIAGRAHNEDAALVSIPSGNAIVQTVDILSPIVNDAYTFGRIAAANALSDVYAMGGKPWCAMNMLFFPSACYGEQGLNNMAQILKGGLDALTEAEAVLVGGHTVEDNEIKYGMSVTGIIDPNKKATNDGLRVGDKLILTKPLGTGILATGVKAKWGDFIESESLLTKYCSKLNDKASKMIGEFNLKAATDITGFGLGGHCIEMARASKVRIVIDTHSVPFFAPALNYASNGLIPTGSHNNKKYWAKFTELSPNLDKNLISIVFDAQTSGGLLLATKSNITEDVVNRLHGLGEEAYIVGEVLDLDYSINNMFLKLV